MLFIFSQEQVSALASTPKLISMVLTQMSISAEFDVRKEATWVVSNLATGGNRAHVQQLVEHGAIRHICDLLDVAEVRILLVAIDALEAILKCSSEGNKYTQLVDEAEGIEKLENLQDHENHEVYQRSMRIIEVYFNGEQEESENVAPVVTNNSYSFGISDSTAAKLDSFSFNPSSASSMFSF
jgi:importin subunit alpha-6/7